MNFAMSDNLARDLEKFNDLLRGHLEPFLNQWYKKEAIPREFFQRLGQDGWLGFTGKNGQFVEQSYLKQTILMEKLATISPGVAVAVMVQISLGMVPLFLFGSEPQKETYLPPAARGETLICLGNTERKAGSDVANIGMEAKKVDGGWMLNGTKAYVTNGAISDLALITAISDPSASRNHRLSMFLVDLTSTGVSRKQLKKRVWIPSDLTRLHFDHVFVPDENLVGKPGKGLQQVLATFTQSRIPISGLTLGTAVGAFEAGLERACKREIFGQRIADFQAKSFEIADFSSRIEAARLLALKAGWTKDQGKDFRMEASMAKYLSVEIARQVGVWAADLFGAASVMQDHPVHKFPMDAWASSLGEGTQDVQKLIIFREIMKKRDII
ncbi:MAG: acyl-CoA dehydrogenase family protein [Deltaproteobacteria bacterium]|jgi:alkylation response protein AidB-like acyl-CoA dehydrogenase|nr:acyl-CoA dehydrogenase family protein [Deltaproteobacteria bacterium]